MTTKLERMNVRIHRGAHEIGGNCIEIEAEGKRIILDIGRPLSAGADEMAPLPPISGLANGDDPNLVGIVISHPHLDHYGLLPQVHKSVPVVIGEAASRILAEASFFSRAGAQLQPAHLLRDREPFAFGPFRITPYLVDHSAFDAYSILVEAGGQRLFYTGDFRGHGRKSALFERLVRAPPRNVDALLMEGTMIRPRDHAARDQATEAEVELRCMRQFKATPGLSLVVYSAQNIDRLVTLYRAAARAGRDFVMDLYTATMARAAGPESIPQPGPMWPRVKVFLPRSQALRVKKTSAFERVALIKPYRIYAEDLASSPGSFVMTFRSSMGRDIEGAGCLDGATVIWSLWSGYLERDEGMQRFCERNGLAVSLEHSSGHAFVEDLRRFVNAIRPAKLVPIHSSATDRFGELFSSVASRRDGEWWPV